MLPPGYGPLPEEDKRNISVTLKDDFNDQACKAAAEAIAKLEGVLYAVPVPDINGDPRSLIVNIADVERANDIKTAIEDMKLGKTRFFPLRA